MERKLIVLMVEVLVVFLSQLQSALQHASVSFVGMLMLHV